MTSDKVNSVTGKKYHLGGGGVGVDWTYPAWRSCGAKANAWTYPAFELILFELISCFFKKETEGFWPGHDERLTLSSMYTYPTWTYQAWTVFVKSIQCQSGSSTLFLFVEASVKGDSAYLTSLVAISARTSCLAETVWVIFPLKSEKC